MTASIARPHARKHLGQVRTPSAIAEWMTDWACAGNPARILEPAVGDGAFVEAIAAAASKTHWRPHIDAYEIDADQIAALRRSGILKSNAVTLTCRHRDFITADIKTSYPCIVANPPYVRHHAMQFPQSVWQRFDSQCGARLSRATNLYGLFILVAWSRLAIGGRAAFITPAEWLNADFGKHLKRYLLAENAIDALIHFHPASQVFSDALTTAVILLLRRGRASSDPIRLIGLGDSSALDVRTLQRARAANPGALDPEKKWTPLFFDSDPDPKGRMMTLGEIADCRRGIATGANQYFTLRPSDCRQWKLRENDVALCITKATQAAGGKLTQREIHDWIDADERVYLFKPARLSASVHEYIAHGIRQKLDRRFLPRHRPVWYLPEQRPPAPILISVFTRNRFRVVLNDARVLNLTAYHGIYPRDGSRAAIDKLFRYLVSARGQKAIAAHRRIYGGGLFKLEPRDVEAVAVPANLLGSVPWGDCAS